MKTLLGSADFSETVPKTPDWFGQRLKHNIEGLDSRTALEHCQGYSKAIVGRKPIGNFKLPSRAIYLGFDAGRRMGEFLLTTPRGIKHYERTQVRTPLGDLARVFEHRLCRSIAYVPQAIRNRDEEAIRQALRCSRGRPIEEWTWLVLTPLP